MLEQITYTEQSPERHERRGPDDSRGRSGRRRGRRCPVEAAGRIADEERRGVQGGALRPLGRVRERVAELFLGPRPRSVVAPGVRGLLERDRGVLEARR